MGRLTTVHDGSTERATVRIRTKIVAALGSLLVLAFGAQSVILVFEEAAGLKREARAEARDIASCLALAVERASRPGPLPAGRELSELIETELGGKATIGKRVSCTVLFRTPLGKETLASAGHLSGGRQITCLQKALVVGEDGQLRELELQVSVPATGTREVLDAAYKPLLATALLALLLGVILFAFLNRSYLRPLMEIRRATEKVSEGHLDTVIRVHTGDELEEVADRFSNMLDRIAEMQEAALDANPLTGLPGNATIQRRVDSAIREGKALAVVYIDLDHFKAYNDVYGFAAGDEVIVCTAALVDEVAHAHDPQAFAGHIGGDDFIFMVQSGLAQEVADEIISKFDAALGDFYSPEDRQRGYIIAKDRQHRESRFPLMAISMGGVDTGSRTFAHFSELAATAAGLKAVAKSKTGSVLVMDRRKD